MIITIQYDECVQKIMKSVLRIGSVSHIRSGESSRCGEIYVRISGISQTAIG